MFGFGYEHAIVLVGCVMIGYVLFGGMIATTWVQIVKAVLLMSGALLLAILVLARFGMSPAALFAAAAERYGEGVLAPGKLVSNPLDALSLGMALMFGTAGLPHILMRFYTVPDARAARTSVFIATGLIGLFYLLTFILGFGAMVLVGPETIRAVDKGGNMAAPLLAELLGGTPFLGFIAAVAFATILAVVAGLTLSGAAALSHDLWVSVVRKGPCRRGRTAQGGADRHAGARHRGGGAGDHVQGPERRLHGVAGIRDRGQRQLPGAGPRRSSGGVTPRPGRSRAWWLGTVAALALIYLSPTLQIDILGRSEAWFPLKNPALVTMPLSFLAGDRRFAACSRAGGGRGYRIGGAARAPGWGVVRKGTTKARRTRSLCLSW